MGAGAAGAQEPPEPPRWSATLEANTDFPLSVGGRLGIESPWHRLSLSTSLGYQPSAYVQAINSASVFLGAYDRNEADLIEDTLRGSFVWRTHLGWRPVANAGLYVGGGYGRGGVGGETSPQNPPAAPTPPQTPADESVLGRDYRVRAVLHL